MARSTLSELRQRLSQAQQRLAPASALMGGLALVVLAVARCTVTATPLPSSNPPDG